MHHSTEELDAIDCVRPDGSLAGAIDLLRDLIAFPSVSATSNRQINAYCHSVLLKLGFRVVGSQYTDSRSVEKHNLVAVRMPGADRLDPQQSGLAYCAHTDVVPAEKWVGPADQESSPFTAQVTETRVYGRGACDMKGSLATMLSAIARVDVNDQNAPLWVVCTADEEVGFDGAKHLVGHCPQYRTLVASDPVTLIGEPTLMNVVYAHKGIMGFKVRSRGRAAHSATTQGINANEAMVPILNTLLEICQRCRSDRSLHDNRFDPPTLSWNFGVSDHMNVVNITPEMSEAWVSLRPMPHVDGRPLIDEAERMALSLGLEFVRFDGCDPIWNDPDCDTVRELCALAGTESQTVCYATDGGVFGELSRRVVIGPGSIEQAHTVDEWIAIEELDRGIDVYEKAIRHWACGSHESVS